MVLPVLIEEAFSVNQSSHCLLCNENVQPVQLVKTSKNGKVLTDIFQVFSKYMKWEPSPEFKYNFRTDPFPFCQDCKIVLTEIYQLHGNIQGIQKQIEQFVLSASARILVSEVKRASSQPDHSEKTIESWESNTWDIKSHYYRGIILKHYSASVQLTPEDYQNVQEFAGKSIGLENVTEDDKDINHSFDPGPVEVKVEAESVSEGSRDNYFHDGGGGEADDDDTRHSIHSDDNSMQSHSQKDDKIDCSPKVCKKIKKEPDETSQEKQPRCLFVKKIGRNKYALGDCCFERLIDKYKCCTCDYAHTSLRNIKKHIRHEHIKDISKHVCETCGYSTLKKSHFDEHLKCHQKVRPFLCNLCGKAFKTDENVRNHRMTAHKNHRFENKIFTIVCTHCGRKFLNQSSLKTHMKHHETVTCHISGKISKERNLEAHLETHELAGQKFFQCPDCGKSFIKSKAGLTIHRKTCRKGSSISCDVCGMEFSQKSNLIRHKNNIHGPNKTTKTLARKTRGNRSAAVQATPADSQDVQEFVGKSIDLKNVTEEGDEDIDHSVVGPEEVEVKVQAGSDSEGTRDDYFQDEAGGEADDGGDTRHSNYSTSVKLERATQQGNDGDHSVVPKPLLEPAEDSRHSQDSEDDLGHDGAIGDEGHHSNFSDDNSMESDSDGTDDLSHSSTKACKKTKAETLRSRTQRDDKSPENKEIPGPRQAYVWRSIKGRVRELGNDRHILDDKLEFEWTGLEWKCLICNFTHFSRPNLIRHLKSKSCTGLASPNSVEVLEHLGYKYDKLMDDSFECRRCPYSSQSDAEIKNHVKEFHYQPKCPDNKWRLLRNVSFTPESDNVFLLNNEHRVRLGEKGKYSCEACSFATTSKNQIILHALRTHGKKRKLLFVKKIGQNKYSVGDYTFEREMDKYKCDTCDYAHMSLRYIKEHIRQEHIKDTSKLVCKLCGYSTLIPHKLEGHMRIHQNERPCLCDVCGKAFKTDARVREHKITVHGDKEILCEQCGAEFGSQKDLWHHVRAHNIVTCHICGRSLSQMSLRAHLWTHEDAGRKLLECEECGKKLVSRFTLARHKKTFHEPNKTTQLEPGNMQS